ncbi:MAG: acyl-CoA thioesterase [Clostridiaceae bacterium]|jgi:acyl-CoA hydrolase|nr:acyl-CoA thioesterase [Clostridiaceae bacterium]
MSEIKQRPCKSVADSMIEMAELVLPNDTNLLGNLLGGRLMHWIDIAGALAASRHSNCVVATAALDSLDFRHPVRVGEMVRLKARITWVGNTSMEVRVDVFCENMKTGATIKSNKAYITFVALDDSGTPTQVPTLCLNTDEERKEYEMAEKRRELRLKNRTRKTQ